jgi:hypothetical protein
MAKVLQIIENSDKLIKFLSTKTLLPHYYNVSSYYNNKTKKLLKQVKHETLMKVIIN